MEPMERWNNGKEVDTRTGDPMEEAQKRRPGVVFAES
jgi:hypothetical protein